MRSSTNPTLKPPMDRRAFLAASASAAAAAAILVSGGTILCPREAWGYETKALAPETMRSLIRVSRDIYPHDRLADRFYAVAMKAQDEKAAADAALKDLYESGMAKLDRLAKAKHDAPYAEVGWEADRVRLLHEIEADPFFQTVRGGLVTGIYNNQEVWPLFGYEGESAAKGGYIDRGFNDLEWL
ncbi:twin-arginine translocation signal domain-containing protein [Azospirillum isscasi]|uniref:Twin-arginine translocation signal domain-containing protein n=1 Tax=Azospirillum isscasi TaxID=3053926 RepID=A0ABU0WLA9_9PROT|nr:twin-arginine translocation signal domain-containing protein [Azospirillum isscasi]MDQ2104882.1 twin-arginine translocation signal domain-containing protein [Azospirillum isscasi]